MRRDLAILLAVATAISASVAPGRGEPDRAPAAGPASAVPAAAVPPSAAPASAAASITARANVIAAGPGRAALAAGASWLTGTEDGAATTADGLARITRVDASPAAGSVLLIEFVAN